LLRRRERRDRRAGTTDVVDPFDRIDELRSSAIPIVDAMPRRRVVIEGTVMRMRARPAHGVPSLAVTVTDDSGSITAVWTGRRAIGGVTLGRRLLVEGVGTQVGDRLEFTNPAYTLLP
jgi:RecG-like helicase